MMGRSRVCVCVDSLQLTTTLQASSRVEEKKDIASIEQRCLAVISPGERIYLL